MIAHDYGQEDGAIWAGIQVFKTSRPNAGLPGVRILHPRATAIWRACRRARADIYYTSCAGFHVGLLAIYARRCGARLIFRTAHDADCEPNGLLIRFWRDKKLYEYGLRHADGVLTQTERQHAAMLANYGIASNTAAMLIDESERRLPFDERSLDVLWVNNFRAFKRPETYLDLSEQIPDLSCHMVGGRLSEAAQLYETTAARAHSIANVNFHGQIPYHAVNDYYGRAKVFVSTSQTEGFPNSYLQSWARGTPVVAFFDPDGVIAQHGLGRVVGSLAEMATAVRTLTGNPHAWESCSARCRSYMAREYAEHRVVQPYVDEIERQLAARRVARGLP
jgi:glycosyltransferase involved in cell wall biosynthesis